MILRDMRESENGDNVVESSRSDTTEKEKTVKEPEQRSKNDTMDSGKEEKMDANNSGANNQENIDEQHPRDANESGEENPNNSKDKHGDDVEKNGDNGRTKQDSRTEMDNTKEDSDGVCIIEKNNPSDEDTNNADKKSANKTKSGISIVRRIANNSGKQNLNNVNKKHTTIVDESYTNKIETTDANNTSDVEIIDTYMNNGGKEMNNFETKSTCNTDKDAKIVELSVDKKEIKDGAAKTKKNVAKDTKNANKRNANKVETDDARKIQKDTKNVATRDVMAVKKTRQGQDGSRGKNFEKNTKNLDEDNVGAKDIEIVAHKDTNNVEKKTNVDEKDTNNIEVTNIDSNKIKKNGSSVDGHNKAEEKKLSTDAQENSLKSNGNTKVDTGKMELKVNMSVRVNVDTKSSSEELDDDKKVAKGKRKRTLTSIFGRDSAGEDTKESNKAKRQKNESDKFCWRCHKEAVDSQCTACPRAWHRRCMGGGTQPSLQNWICGECATILKAENAETRSPAMTQISVDQLCTLLKHVVERMRDYPGSEPFWKAVDLHEVPNYLDYVVKPMDLCLLEANVTAKLYGSTEAFMAEAKWIQHNCIVFNTCGGVYADTSKLTNAARQIITVARKEVSEIEACPDCYGNARSLFRSHPSWFVEPCRRPHTLVWAKLKGFPFWPAKAMPRVNSQGLVDVRFFGAHDRAWVPTRDLYLYSEDPPTPAPRRRKPDMDECVVEITRHCRKLELAFGLFKFAPPKIQYNPKDPLQIKLMLPNYDPLNPSNPVIPAPSTIIESSRRKVTINKRPLESREKKSPSMGAEASSNSDSANDTSKADSSSDCEKQMEIGRVPRIVEVDSNDNRSSKTTLSSKQDDLVVGKKPLRKRRISDVTDTKKPTKKRSNSDRSTDEEIVRTVRDKNGKLSASKVSAIESRIAKADAEKRDEASKPESTAVQSAPSVGTPQEARSKTKHSPKANRSLIRVYKPKTRMVDQVNAERAKETAANQKQGKTTIVSDEIIASSNPAVTNNNVMSTTASTKKMTNANSGTSMNTANNSEMISTAGSNVETRPEPTVSYLLLMNNVSLDPTRRTKLFEDTPTVIKQEPKELSSPRHPNRKESKARKSFPNKAPIFPQIAPTSPNNQLTNPRDAMVYIPANRTENQTEYQLTPPEAGPLTAQLHRSGQELAKRMTQLMGEALAEAAQLNYNSEGSEANQLATVHHLRLQIERMRWQHEQHLAELKHNTDLTLREMRASLEAERYRAIEETKREAEDERLRCVEETKRKQWCALCGSEALFYCCWNTAYCDYPCQQAHWSTHMRTCAQNPPPNAIITTAANVTPQQNGATKPPGQHYIHHNGAIKPVTTSRQCVARVLSLQSLKIQH